ncbi:MAG: TraB/GumN family protein [Burkholderiales bacterium]|nr:MAG: TraB/GumN family protein [Betaproteobacteria bacterium]TAG24657.1 MAG: TraB/GumN family protein [Burkholderiales bacterium]
MKRFSQLLSVATATTVAALFATSASAQLNNPFLWELSKGGKTMYLFGSLHIGKPDFYPVPPAIRLRFDEAEILAVEADVTEPATRNACQRLAVTEEKIEKLLSADELLELTRYLQAAKVNPKAVEGKKLWMVNLLLTVIELQQLGVDFEDGPDVVVARQARELKKKIVEIEGPKQCAALAGADQAESLAGLNRFLTSVRENKMERRIDLMLDAYRAGDGNAIHKVSTEEYGDTPMGKKSKARVFDDRHPIMAETIDGYFAKKESHFVVISAGRMFGDNNLAQALEKRGVKLKRVQ